MKRIPESCDEVMSGEYPWDTDKWDFEGYNGRKEYVRWPEGYAKPRTCPYCGSVHPDDLLVLISQGWECEPSDKPYKTYWNPPGSKAAFDAAINRMKVDPLLPIRREGPVLPVPCVMLYSNHLSG